MSNPSEEKRKNGYYPYGDKLLPSVTHILDTVMAKPWLIPWVKAEASKALLDPPSSAYTPEEIAYCLNAHKRKSDEAKEFGSLVHFWLDACNRHGRRKITPPDEVKGYIDQYHAMFRDYGMRLVDTEQTVYHPIGYAGTLDMVVDIDDIKYVVDFKTSKQIGYEYFLQTEAYRRAWNRVNEVYVEDEDGRQDCQVADGRILWTINKVTEQVEEPLFIPQEENDEDWRSFTACLLLFEGSKGFRRRLTKIKKANLEICAIEENEAA